MWSAFAGHRHGAVAAGGWAHDHSNQVHFEIVNPRGSSSHDHVHDADCDCGPRGLFQATCGKIGLAGCKMAQLHGHCDAIWRRHCDYAVWGHSLHGVALWPDGLDVNFCSAFRLNSAVSTLNCVKSATVARLALARVALLAADNYIKLKPWEAERS